jgi:hypothetical protein
MYNRVGRIVSIACLLFLIVSIISLGSFLPVQAIAFGEPDGDGHPYVGIIVVYNASGQPLWRGSGTLLSPTVFLTAGHITNGGAFAVVSFESEITNESVRYFAFQLYTKPGYDLTRSSLPNTNDLGIAILSQPISLSEYGVLPDIGLLDEMTTRRGQQDTTFTVVGYGYQSIKPVFQADVVRNKGTTTLINLKSHLTDGYNIQTSSNPGKAQGTGGTCFGDSGGPVFLGDSNIVVGVISFGLNDNCKGVGFAYRADIASSQEFIKSFLP